MCTPVCCVDTVSMTKTRIMAVGTCASSTNTRRPVPVSGATRDLHKHHAQTRHQSQAVTTTTGRYGLDTASVTRATGERGEEGMRKGWGGGEEGGSPASKAPHAANTNIEILMKLATIIT